MASSSGLDISLTVLGNIVDLYNRNTAVVINAAQHNPSALLDDAFTGSIGSSSGFTKEVQLTNFKPSGTARYYYALLGMAAMMAMSFAVNAVRWPRQTCRHLAFAVPSLPCRNCNSCWQVFFPVGSARS